MAFTSAITSKLLNSSYKLLSLGLPTPAQIPLAPIKFFKFFHAQTSCIYVATILAPFEYIPITILSNRLSLYISQSHGLLF